MPRILKLTILLFWTAGAGVGSAAQGKTSPLPSLDWQVRSDWINVRLLGARGDGKADDTAAIQKALSQVRNAVSPASQRGNR